MVPRVDRRLSTPWLSELRLAERVRLRETIQEKPDGVGIGRLDPDRKAQRRPTNHHSIHDQRVPLFFQDGDPDPRVYGGLDAHFVNPRARSREVSQDADPIEPAR